jgi:hypothetical protein
VWSKPAIARALPRPTQRKGQKSAIFYSYAYPEDITRCAAFKLITVMRMPRLELAMLITVKSGSAGRTKPHDPVQVDTVIEDRSG